MRTYAKNYKVNGASKPYVSRKEYRTRESTEWDVRVDCVHGITPETIRSQMQVRLPELVYGLIGGMENPDVGLLTAPTFQGTNPQFSPTGSRENHVHVALVFLVPVCRATALKMCRETKVGDEYATPRNRKFTYAGWLAHHTKAAFKVDPESTLFYEYGTLPMDSYEEETCWRVLKILKKFGNPEIKTRFSSYYDKIDDIKAAKATEVPAELLAMVPKEH